MEVRSDENDGSGRRKFAVAGDGAIAFYRCPGRSLFSARPKHGASPLLSGWSVPSEWLRRAIGRKRRPPASGGANPIRVPAGGGKTVQMQPTFGHGYLSNCRVASRFACGERFLYGRNHQREGPRLRCYDQPISEHDGVSRGAP